MIPFLCKYSSPNNNCFVYVLITCLTKQTIRFAFKTPTFIDNFFFSVYFLYAEISFNEVYHSLKKTRYDISWVCKNLQPQGKIQISPKVKILIHQGQTPTEYLRFPPPSRYPNISNEPKQSTLSEEWKASSI